MMNEKGYLWASNYWSKNVYRQATNQINEGDPYGAKGGMFWEIIALSEGWANFREWYLAKTYLDEYCVFPMIFDASTGLYRQKTFDDYKNSSLAIYYGGIFRRLIDLGCSYNNLEKSLCANSIMEFKNNIIRSYPHLEIQILNILKNYE